MTETTVTPERPLVVEEGDVKPGFIGQNVPRKEDKRLVQGEGVFFDDVKRHEMGLDLPLFRQYLIWLGQVLHGDFGTSIHFRRGVAGLVGSTLPATRPA